MQEYGFYETDSKSYILKCKTKKSNSGLQTGKKYQKPEFLTEQLERSNFINLIS